MVNHGYSISLTITEPMVQFGSVCSSLAVPKQLLATLIDINLSLRIHTRASVARLRAQIAAFDI
jgi:hypothetical protein